MRTAFLSKRCDRQVHYANSALHAELVRGKSILIANGVTRPVLALRMTDRAGRPVRSGLVGDFILPAPYYPAVEANAQAARQLSGLERARPVWHVEGDEGIAYVELEPTTASGGLSITLPFRDGDVTRKQTIQTWLTPGKRPWTIVGFAAGTVGFNTLNGRTETLGAGSEHWYGDARLALYAKGRIKGKWLMTLAYDSDKAKDRVPLCRNDRSRGLLYNLCRSQRATLRRLECPQALSEARTPAILRSVRRL